MLDFIVPFLVYAIAFAAGSVAAFAVARRRYPATSEEEALAQLEAAAAPDGALR
nr:hypothetical protein [Propionibacterium sp.]